MNIIVNLGCRIERLRKFQERKTVKNTKHAVFENSIKYKYTKISNFGFCSIYLVRVIRTSVLSSRIHRVNEESEDMEQNLIYY